MKKHSRTLCALVTALAFVSLNSDARAWGAVGHKIICEIAFRLANPNTQDAIKKLIALDAEYKTFSNSCIFPDHPRQRAPEHFVNLPRDLKGTHIG